MGLLDFDDQEDEFAFANFDSGFSPATKQFASKDSVESSKPSVNYLAHGTSLESVNTSTSSSTTSSRSSSSSSAHKSRSQTSGKAIRRPHAKRVGSGTGSFDLFGQDEELQDAEPKITFCSICLKHCGIHENDIEQITND